MSATTAAPVRTGTAPSFALAVAFAIAPVAVVLQSKAIAPIATIALLCTVLLHVRLRGEWPWPRGLAALAALLLFGWAALTAAWALRPWTALGTSLQIGGFVALGAMAARAIAEDGTAARDHMLRWAAWGLAAGLLVAAVDYASGNAIRAAVRGMATAPPGLIFGLKPAASAMALWLPLAAAAPLPVAFRAALVAVGAAILLWLPGEAARIAVVAGAAAGAATLLLPRRMPGMLGAGLAAMIVLMPAVLGPVLARGVDASPLPPSAAHRLMIWDFAIGRIAERPLAGWGMEASRSLPGHGDRPTPEMLARFGFADPAAAAWIPSAEMLPLHPHNAALQLWLELGLPGAALAGLLVWLLGRAAARGARPAVAAAVLASGAVTALLSFGAWQEWWVGAELMAVAAAAGTMPSGASKRTA